MPFQAIESQRMYQQIAGQIRDMIHSGEFKSGDRLPPERSLALAFGVSRNVVREAMVALEIGGLIEIRIGAGTFVTRSPASPEHDLRPGTAALTPPKATDVFAAHHLIEGEIAAHAARHADGESLRTLLECVEALEDTTISSETARHWDLAFHLRLAACTRNVMLIDVVEFMQQRAQSGPAPVLPPVGPSSVDAAAYRRVYDAVQRRKPEAARSAMHQLLANARPLVFP